MASGISDGFVSISPFSKKDSASSKLQSDHVEVAVNTVIGTINGWNISNPAYHRFFAKDASQVFAQTSLADISSEALEGKIASQLKTISTRLLSGEVNIQVVVEGYETFFEKLAKQLSEGNFHLLAEKPEGWNEKKNITGIVVDTSKYTVRESAVVTVEYKDTENDGRPSVLRVPYVHVQEIVSKKEMIVAGVHVPGAASQYPKDGLAALANAIDSLWEKHGRKVDVIGIGDFNSTPERVAKHFEGAVLAPDYWTHANPRFLAASKYDMAIVREAESEPVKCEMHPLADVSETSQALAKGLKSLTNC